MEPGANFIALGTVNEHANFDIEPRRQGKTKGRLATNCVYLETSIFADYSRRPRWKFTGHNVSILNLLE